MKKSLLLFISFITLFILIFDVNANLYEFAKCEKFNFICCRGYDSEAVEHKIWYYRGPNNNQKCNDYRKYYKQYRLCTESTASHPGKNVISFCQRRTGRYPNFK